MFQSPDWRWTTVNANLLFKCRQQWRQGKVKLPSEYETSPALTEYGSSLDITDSVYW
ncbi:hypothetical protein ACT497_004903 [Salmonella enterica subsp. enterica serovar Glostrup]|nr:hypothetical protein [Salmonella enterica subsp. enterica serovar Madelia]